MGGRSDACVCHWSLAIALFETETKIVRGPWCNVFSFDEDGDIDRDNVTPTPCSIRRRRENFLDKHPPTPQRNNKEANMNGDGILNPLNRHHTGKPNPRHNTQTRPSTSLLSSFIPPPSPPHNQNQNHTGRDEKREPGAQVTQSALSAAAQSYLGGGRGTDQKIEVGRVRRKRSHSLASRAWVLGGRNWDGWMDGWTDGTHSASFRLLASSCATLYCIVLYCIELLRLGIRYAMYALCGWGCGCCVDAITHVVSVVAAPAPLRFASCISPVCFRSSDR